MITGKIVALSKNPIHNLGKQNHSDITLLKGLGVEGDVHMGKTVKHRSRVAKDPYQANLRQVHLIHSELFEELKTKGFSVLPGQMGENITTSELDLLQLPKNSILKIGAEAEVMITGLRNPCYQLDGIQPGLMQAVIEKDSSGNLIRKAGIMGIVIKTGKVKLTDEIQVFYPVEPHIKLDKV